MRGCSTRQYSPFLHSLFAIILFLIQFELQASHKVYPDQYIVKKRKNTFSVSSVEKISEQFSIETLTAGNEGPILLEAKKFLKLQSLDNSVQYDPSLDKCPELMATGNFEYCSPNFEVKALGTPNDPSFTSLWGLSRISAPVAWDQNHDSSIVVAIIDTGADLNHPDLVNNFWTNPNEIQNGIDDDNNGIIDDIHGASFYNSTPTGSPYDDNGHGTHVAGTIGANGNNGQGVVGVLWNARIMPVKFLGGSSGVGSIANAIRGINYVIEMKKRGIDVRVMNNSWGGGSFSPALEEAIKEANRAGIIFVAAAGNEANDNDFNPTYPASYNIPNVVSVAAVDDNDNMASFSNYGASSVIIGAPGVGIMSTYPGGRYAQMSGTSMAAPHVTGALTLLFGKFPELSTTAAISRITDTGEVLPTLNSAVRGARFLNLKRMLDGDVSAPSPEPDYPVCSYQTDEIPFSEPDIKLGEPVIRADEFDFFTVPFNFVFGGKSSSRVILSPNGVAYFDRGPLGMDYEISSKAPVNSVASFQTDLATEAPGGVYYEIRDNGNTLVAKWVAEHFEARGEGFVESWIVLHSDTQTIETYARFANSLVARVQKGTLVGVTPSQENRGVVFAKGGKHIKSNGFGVKYTPVCDGSVPSPHYLSAIVEKVRISTVKRTRRPLQVTARGEGYGPVSVNFSINGTRCKEIPTFQMKRGKLRLRTVIPSLLRKGRKKAFAVSIGDTTSSKIFRRYSKTKKSSRISSSQYARACASIRNHLRQM